MNKIIELEVTEQEYKKIKGKIGKILSERNAEYKKLSIDDLNQILTKATGKKIDINNIDTLKLRVQISHAYACNGFYVDIDIYEMSGVEIKARYEGEKKPYYINVDVWESEILEKLRDEIWERYSPYALMEYKKSELRDLIFDEELKKLVKEKAFKIDFDTWSYPE